ncbi:MAG: M15 family peptidase [Ignavibacteria bacterium]|nr:M15 family peptidase [Ignavibacteria bacterium]
MEAAKYRNISITCGHRSDEDQDQAFEDGTTTKQAGESDHNVLPSLAVDAIPFPTTQEDWENREYWVEWSSWIKGLGSGMGMIIRSGFDWDNDYDLDDQSFFDGPHFEYEGEFDA